VQRLGKHIPVARQQIINNATVGLQKWKWGVPTWSSPDVISKGQRQLEECSAESPAVKRTLVCNSVRLL
jgi:hypothetical protein